MGGSDAEEQEEATSYLKANMHPGLYESRSDATFRVWRPPVLLDTRQTSLSCSSRTRLSRRRENNVLQIPNRKPESVGLVVSVILYLLAHGYQRRPRYRPFVILVQHIFHASTQRVQDVFMETHGETSHHGD